MHAWCIRFLAGRVYFTERNGTERNVSAELLRYKIRNGTSQIISCDPSDHTSTCIRHFSCIEHSTKYFTAVYLYAYYTSYFTGRAVAVELKLSRAAYS